MVRCTVAHAGNDHRLGAQELTRTTWGRDMHKWSWSFFLRKWTNCHLKRDHFLERTRVIFQASILRGSVSFRFFFFEDHHLKKHQFYDSKNSVDHFSKTTLCRLGLKLTALNVSFSQPWSCRSNGGWRCVFGPTSGPNFVPTFSQEAPPAIISLYPGQAAAFQLLDWNVYIFWIDAGGWHHFGNLLSISCRAVIDNVYAFFQKPDPCQIRWIWRTSASPCLVQVFFRRVPSRLKEKVHQLAWEMFWCCGRDLKIHLWDFNVIAAVTQL